MHYTPHAILNCVAWFLLSQGNAARIAPKEALSHFTRSVGSILEPTLANEIKNSRANPKGAKVTRRQVDTRPGLDQEPNNISRPTPIDQPYLNQGYPFQYERTQQFRYPPYNQQFSQNFFPGPGGLVNGNQPLPNGYPIDPRFFQLPFRNRGIEPLQPNSNRALNNPNNNNNNDNDNDNSKDNKNNNKNSINTLQNLDSNIDSKSSAQNRPFDGPEFLNQGNGNNQDPGPGNYRVDNRFSAIDYERIRQNYYSDPPINQQRNYYSNYNDIRLNGGPPYRPGLGGRYPGLDYPGGGNPGRPGIPSSDLRSAGGIDGIGDNYFNGFGPGPYRPFNSLAGNIGGGGIGGGGGNLPFSDNFGLPFNGGQYPGGFGGGYYNGGPGTFGYNNGGDSSLRASASKETVSEALTPRESSQKTKQKNQFNEEKGKASSTRNPNKEHKGEA